MDCSSELSLSGDVEGAGGWINNQLNPRTMAWFLSSGLSSCRQTGMFESWMDGYRQGEGSLTCSRSMLTGTACPSRPSQGPRRSAGVRCLLLVAWLVEADPSADTPWDFGWGTNRAAHPEELQMLLSDAPSPKALGPGVKNRSGSSDRRSSFQLYPESRTPLREAGEFTRCVPKCSAPQKHIRRLWQHVVCATGQDTGGGSAESAGALAAYPSSTG